LEIKPTNAGQAGDVKLDEGYIRRINLALEVLFHGKWSVQILCAMRPGPIRLGQLARLIPGASKKVLTQNLRKLESEGIVVRRDFSDVVLYVEYAFDNNAKESVCALMDHLAAWKDLEIDKQT
jgi:DNA-binding HxlR family transcriptional regulator